MNLKKYVCLLSALVALTIISTAQSIPGTLTNATKDSTQNIDDCTVTTTTHSWTFTDSAGAHPFPGLSSLVLWSGSHLWCHSVQASPLSTWSSDGLYYLQGTVSGVAVSEAVTAAGGHVNPKYIVLGVTYAPPGHASTVSYMNSTSLGTTTMNSSSFAQGYSESVSITGQTGSCDSGSVGGIIGFSGGVCVTGTQSSSYTLQSNTSNSISIVNKTSLSDTTTGTPNDFSPVNHDYDLVWLWLNPVVVFSYAPANPKNIEWLGYGFDMADQPAMDVWPVLLGYLNGDFGALDTEDAQVLSRSWVAKYNPQTWPTGQGPGLTTADLRNIAKADPWGANPSYSVILGQTNPPTTTDGRFTITPVNGINSQSFDYKQAGPGNGSGLTQMYTNENTTTTTVTNGTMYTNQQAFGLEEKVGGSFFWQSVQFDFKQSSTFTWTHSSLLTKTGSTDSTDALTIIGPPCPANPGPCKPQYSGFPEFDVYQDNLFGTFMFWGVN